MLSLVEGVLQNGEMIVVAFPYLLCGEENQVTEKRITFMKAWKAGD